jgi:CBS domain-containing protein
MKVKKMPYRSVIVDDDRKFKGVLSARRILEVIMDKRGTVLKEEIGLKRLLQEPVGIFTDESHQIFHEDVGVDIVLKYMSENLLGYVVLVDVANAYKGVIEEIDFLEHLKGKSLGLCVKELMKRRVFTINYDSTIHLATEKILKERIKRLPIVKDGYLAGIITVNDVIRHLLSRNEIPEILNKKNIEDALSKGVESITNKKVIVCHEMDDIGEVAKIMVDLDISGLPVVSKEDNLVGIVSRIDLIAGAVRGRGANAVIEMMK